MHISLNNFQRIRGPALRTPTHELRLRSCSRGWRFQRAIDIGFDSSFDHQPNDTAGSKEVHPKHDQPSWSSQSNGYGFSSQWI